MNATFVLLGPLSLLGQTLQSILLKIGMTEIASAQRLHMSKLMTVKIKEAMWREVSMKISSPTYYKYVSKS